MLYCYCVGGVKASTDECGSTEGESDVFVSYANGAGPMPPQQGEQW